MNDDMLLRQIGEALYGVPWYSKVTDDLGLNRRTIQRWLNREEPVPPGIWDDLDRLMDERIEKLTQLRGRLSTRTRPAAEVG